MSIDYALLATLPDTLVLNFPVRASVTLQRTRAEPRGANAFLWTGRGGDCSALFSAAAVGFRAVISCLNAPYEVDWRAGGPAPTLVQSGAAGAAPLEPPPAAPAPPLAPADAPPSAPNLIVDQEIDVRVLFSEDVRQVLDPGGGVANTVQFMRTAVDLTQMAMDHSVPKGDAPLAELHFVAARKVSRADSGNLPEDLRYLRSDAEPLALRNYWAADIVMYVTKTGGIYDGVANVPGNGLPGPGQGFAPYAQGVVVQDVAISPNNWVFSHEFGHIFGANHNTEDNTNPTPLHPWAFAHWAIDPEAERGERTLLAYDRCNIQGMHVPCTRILNYANPAVYVDWFHTGTANHNNASVIHEFAPAPYTASYRASLGRIFADGFE